MREQPRRTLRLVITPIVESAVVGMIAGGTAAVILPGGIATMSAGIAPGLVIGIAVGFILAGMHLKTDAKSDLSTTKRFRVLLWMVGAAVSAFLVTAFCTSNPQIPSTERLILCSGVAVAYGFLTYRALTHPQRNHRSLRA